MPSEKHACVIYSASTTESDQSQNWNCFGGTLFVFDTSVLLELFERSVEARKTWLQIIRRIKPEQRWLPYQVAREYHSRVDRVIGRHFKERSDEIGELTKNLKKVSVDQLAKREFFLGADVATEIKPGVDELTEARDKWSSQINKTVGKLKQRYVKDCEQTKKQLADLFDGAVGAPFTDEEHARFHEIALRRIADQIPPGYADSDKANRTGNQPEMFTPGYRY